MPELFNYHSAMAQMADFLVEQSLPPKVALVFADDLAWTGGKLCVRSPTPDENNDALRSLIESEAAQRFGVELRTVARTATATICGLVVPQDEREAGELMISGLKLSVPDCLLDAVEVSGSLRWKLIRMHHREPSPFAGIAGRP